MCLVSTINGSQGRNLRQIDGVIWSGREHRLVDRTVDRAAWRIHDGRTLHRTYTHLDNIPRNGMGGVPQRNRVIYTTTSLRHGAVATRRITRPTAAVLCKPIKSLYNLGRPHLNWKTAIDMVSRSLSHCPIERSHSTFLLARLPTAARRIDRAIMHNHSLDGGIREPRMELLRPGIANAACEIGVGASLLDETAHLVGDLVKRRVETFYRGRLTRAPTRLS